ncbi:ANTAR domain-containing protein [Nocardioides hwasunensis]|uniref:ANTAR domain-containing protein n=1 Tax=Nocardioides hwasunensis TaxID=397258 RepID=A0ABR8MME8_9ACTN|nr:ANTAR domain-containing protein [Nocardioides hwasunensis]MBD3915704.1 ANTAR domain-containing protein [Nocardioides hwasunensis]
MPVTPPHPGEPAQPADALHDEIAHLHHTGRSHRAVGMAVGLASVRFACTTAQARRLLVRVSHRTGTDVQTVAQVLVSTHDGTATAEDRRLLTILLDHLPPAGWPAGPWPRDDLER